MRPSCIALSGALLFGVACELPEEQALDVDTSIERSAGPIAAAAPPIDLPDKQIDEQIDEPLDEEAAIDEAAAQVPSGAIMFFDTRDCPIGWSALDAARGRVVVGLPERGTLGGTVGTPLGNQENRSHSHGVIVGNHSHRVAVQGYTTAAGSHRHQWTEVTGGDWYSWDSGGTKVNIGVWDNGIGNDGDGNYPLFTESTGLRRYYTTAAGNHTHGIDITATALASGQDGTGAGSMMSSVASTAQVIPYIQLLVCRKD